MKKNDFILLFATVSYSYLFYQQGLGINLLIFSILLIALLLIKGPKSRNNISWLVAAVGSIISSCCIAYYGNHLSFWANIFSLMLLSAFSIQPKTSVIFSFLFSCYSISASSIFMVLDWIKRIGEKEKNNGAEKKQNKYGIYVFSILVVTIFFLLYKGSNPLFDNFTKKISFDFISLPLVFFSIGGFFLLYGFFYYRDISTIRIWDETVSNTINPNKVSDSFFNWNTEVELKSGIVLLSMLNILLFSVNVLDLNFMWIGKKFPDGLTYSAFVHQGTELLIISIIIAILIILFYFRGSLNFHSSNKYLKVLAYLWIFQNSFMIISTAYRNSLYIQEYSLTYKRIDVYIWLLLALIGLLVTVFKLINKKSNWFLFRANGWLFYSVFVISCFINWDALIADFNINSAIKNKKPLDKFYLLTLSNNILPQLIRLDNSIETKRLNEFEFRDYLYGRLYDDDDFKTMLQEKINDFKEEMIQKKWQSWNYYDTRTYSEITNMYLK